MLRCSRQLRQLPGCACSGTCMVAVLIGCCCRRCSRPTCWPACLIRLVKSSCITERLCSSSAEPISRCNPCAAPSWWPQPSRTLSRVLLTLPSSPTQGRDHTIFSLVEGRVKFIRDARTKRRYVGVEPLQQPQQKRVQAAAAAEAAAA